jgi:ribosomal protein L7/L12
MDYTIRTARNGYILTDWNGNEHVALTLVEAARMVGEILPDNTQTKYVHQFGAAELEKAREAFKAGQKIEAIKYVRNTFTPRLGLLEAKELVETFMG